MGMFDYVNFEMPCPKCGIVLNSFQTGDGDGELQVLEPDDVGEFYRNCHGCRSFVAFVKDKAEPTPARSRAATIEEVEKMGFRMTLYPPAGAL